MITRRQFLQHGALLAGAALLAGPGRRWPELRLDTGVDVVAYLDQTAAYHRDQVDRLKAAGYQILSLSLYDTPVRYAAVFIRRAGPDWQQADGITSAQLATTVDQRAAKGYYPAIITAASTASYAVVMVKSAVPTTLKVDLFSGDPENRGTFDYWLQWGLKNNQMLTWATVYGPALRRRYAGIWTPNPLRVAWNAAIDRSKFVDRRYDAQTLNGYSRLAFIAPTSDGSDLQIYRDDGIGESIPFHDLTSAQFDAQSGTLSAKGYYPVCLQGAGSGDSRRFGAIFVKSEAPVARQFRVTGQTVPARADLDEFMQEVLQGGGIRAGALAVARAGKLVFARGYTWAEPDYPTTQPDSLFRLASCSKPITNIGIHNAVQQGLIPAFETTIQSLLGLKSPDGGPPVDPQFNDVQIRHLLSHTGGWNKRSGRYGGSGFDPMFHDLEIGQALNKRFPISKADIATFMAGQPLQFKPGSQQAYSNFGYMLLGLAIEKVSGIPYDLFIRKRIFEPLGIRRPLLGRSLWENRAPNEVPYHDNTAWVSYDKVTPTGDWLPGPYGTFNLENLDSVGGWVSSAPDYAKLLAAFHKGISNPLLMADLASDVFNRDYWDDDSSSQHAVKEGLLSGTETYAIQRLDDMSVVALFNRDNSLPDSLPILKLKATDFPYQFDDVASRLTWPDEDLFPTVGLPVF
ncbi:MAG TPA: serine hydrolase [Aggregatilineales bacterium]|nr:serine hydrolase [Aggregatilineales bacterium]